MVHPREILRAAAVTWQRNHQLAYMIAATAQEWPAGTREEADRTLGTSGALLGAAVRLYLRSV